MGDTPHGSGDPLNSTFSEHWNDIVENEVNPKKFRRDKSEVSDKSSSTNPEKIEDKKDNSNNDIDAMLIKQVKPLYEKKDDNVYKVNVTTTHEDIRISRMRMVQILLKSKIQNVFDIKSIARNKLCVYFNDFATANKFCDVNLTSFNLKAEIPLHYVCVVGVVRGIPLDMNMTDLHGIIKNSEKIIKLERIFRKNKSAENNGTEDKTPTLSVKITFNLPIPPKEIDLTYYKEKVHPFISGTRQCQKCFRFGHTKFQCKSQARCDKCGADHQTLECKALKAECLHCHGNHLASSLNCPERSRQNNIKIIMATKNLSYNETVEMFPQYTNNRFNLLENIDEFPTLTRANYSRVLRVNNKKSKIITKETMTPVKVIYEDRNKWNRQRENLAYTDDTFEPIHENPHRTSEAERFIHQVSKSSNQTAQSSSNFETYLNSDNSKINLNINTNNPLINNLIQNPNSPENPEDVEIEGNDL